LSSSQQSTAPSQPGGDGKRVFVHIGAPKTGTTFIQNVLWSNHDRLREAGFLYPYERPSEHLGAMLDLRQMPWGDYPDPKHWRRRWDAVAERSRAWPGHTVLLTNEMLGGASREQIERLVDSVQPAEVHVVFTARDLARQLVSDWQEHIKHKHTVTLERFVDDLVELGIEAPHPFGQMFWGLHDAAYVLPRWADVVPEQRIHVVTVPQPGNLSTTLWQRFCAAVDLPPQLCSLEVERANESLGIAEAELLRRANAELSKLRSDEYDALVRRRLVRTLAGRSARPVLPPQHLPWMVERSDRLISQLRHSGYSVVGDLEELRPLPADHAGYVATSALDADQMMSSAVLGMAAALRIAARQRAGTRELKEEYGLLPEEAAAQRSSRPSGIRGLVPRIRARARSGRIVLGRSRAGRALLARARLRR